MHGTCVAWVFDELADTKFASVSDSLFFCTRQSLSLPWCLHHKQQTSVRYLMQINGPETASGYTTGLSRYGYV
jgi:hypothetical protein